MIACSFFMIVFVSSARAQDVSWPVQWLDRQSPEKGRLVWKKNTNQWELQPNDGPAKKLTDVQSIQAETAPTPYKSTGEQPLRTVAVLGHQERLTGDILKLDADRMLAITPLSGHSVAIPVSEVTGWSFHEHVTTLVFKDFEDHAGAIAGPTGISRVQGQKSVQIAKPVQIDLPEVLPLSDGEHAIQFGFYVDGQKNLPELVLNINGNTTDKKKQSLHLKFESGAKQIKVTAEAESGPEMPAGQLTVKPGWHWFTCQWRRDRTRISIDDLVIAESKSAWLKLPTIASLQFSENDMTSPDHWTIDAVGLYEYAKVDAPVQRSAATDLIQLTGGHELFGELQSITSNNLVFLGESTVTIPFGQVRTLIGRDDKRTGRWVLGQVAKITFRNSGKSIWSGETEPEVINRLGLLNPPPDGMDAVEAVLTDLTNDFLEASLSQGGTIRVNKADLAMIQPVGAGGLRVLESRPHHLGDEVDLKVVPLEPEGNRLAIAFETNAQEANYNTSLAIDVLQVLGANIPPFVESIKRGELITEVWLNNTLIDNLNRHVLDRNEKPQRLMMNVPKGLIKSGENLLEFRQKGQKNNPNYLDDLSILGVRLYRID